MQTTICNIHFLSDLPENVLWLRVPCTYMLMKNKSIVKIGKTKNLSKTVKRLCKELQFDYIYAVYKAQYYQDIKKENRVIALFYDIFRLCYEIEKEYGGKT